VAQRERLRALAEQRESTMADTLGVDSWALVEQLRAVATDRCGPAIGNVGPAVAAQPLDVLAMITGMP
jgi:mRNA-degrading endonuclease toxin of MazEF toxin-antitoxin module